MYNVFIARQPIYNKKLEVIGYELLFRDESGECSGIADSELATAQVILNIVLEVGLEQIVGQRSAFINVSRDFILNDLVYSLDKSRIILELSENITADPEVISALKKLSGMGYKISLDNFVYHYSKDELVALADYIKFDVSKLGADELKSQVNLLRNNHINLIASKVETQKDFDLCNELALDYFQGYFLAHPNMIRGTRLSAIRYSILELHEKLQQENIIPADIEELISKDLCLTYRIFNYVNEHNSGSKTVSTLRDAVELVGLEEIKTWVELLVISKLDDRPNELLVSALTRAKMCELLALSVRGVVDTGSYFLVGLFSHMDVILDKKMPDMLKTLPFSDTINEALLYRKGKMGDALNCVAAYERGDWEAVRFEDVEKNVIIGCYLKSIEWASNLDSELIAC